MQAADCGHKVAAFNLGVMLEKDHDLVAARSRYEQARELGHTLAEKYLTGADREGNRHLGQATQARRDARSGRDR